MRFLKFPAGLLLIAAGPIGCGPPVYDGTSGWVQVAPGVSFALEDGEQYRREAPDTFEIPPKAARETLRPGQIVKLMFNIKADGKSQIERMWVVVEGEHKDGYAGLLDNQPMATEKMRPGMRIRFYPRHVINIYPQRADRKT
jgi:hypothetical protein